MFEPKSIDDFKVGDLFTYYSECHKTDVVLGIILRIERAPRKNKIHYYPLKIYKDWQQGPYLWIFLYEMKLYKIYSRKKKDI